MGWKDFLRPSKRKLVLFVILYAIAFLFVLSFNFRFIVLPGLATVFPYTLPVFIIRGLLALIAWYLIACFIVWAYGKSRKKK